MFIDEIQVGQTASLSRTVTQADIAGFADVTGDRNPLHLDPGYAAATPFKGVVAHGMLSAGYISAVFGTILPGPGAIYLSQTLRFLAPVRPGDHVVTAVKAEEVDLRRRRVRFTTVCSVAGKAVLDGEAWLMVPARS